MEKNILVINCGSSSLKYEVFSMPGRQSLGKGLVERIGSEHGVISQQSEKGRYEAEFPAPDHHVALEKVLVAITNKELGILNNMNEIAAVGHRVVHGGEKYSSSVIIDDEVMKAIEDYIELAPLHNPPNLTGIQVAKSILPGVAQVAVFDTAFHQTLPPAAYLYGLPREFYDKYQIRRYGFHGTSHRYVSARALELLKRDAENTNIITCHLGNGASITAIEHGKSVDTSMGFTPLEGLVMGTRCGDIDPSIIAYLMDRGYTIKQLNDIMNKKSGLLGLSGLSNDLRDLEKAAAEGDKNATEALEVYAYRIRKYIGGYAANLVKVDALVFTGGIGQWGVNMRRRICSRLENLGIVLDYNKNQEVGGTEGLVSKYYSQVSILVIPTQEELQIATDTFNLAFGG